ncbi:hypothetical protein NRK68_20815 [Streptomyces yangpuensis]|uniref:Uncharacterized protein n=1 Tax=Streptomyces yangpuensis TaxID=1648182 RepID=A0ABY5PZJ6_9ACTN|nr:MULTISPECIES: hypothetical protein [Streptomyces]MBZ9597642.1 hypothetical protein [Streptomyces erythrochromogenes]UUY49440.1 hypothetical protein NRK68_20815 [Streptomyces yangpuensis]
MSVSRRTRTLLTTTAAALLLSVAGPGLATAAGGATTAAPAAVREIRAPAFNAGGVWYLFQTNATVRVDLTQDGAGRLFGTVSSGNTVGTLREGSVDGNNIYFIVGWNHGPVGRYTGVRGPDGRLSGTTFDLTNPSSQATWRTDRTF